MEVRTYTRKSIRANVPFWAQNGTLKAIINSIATFDSREEFPNPPKIFKKEQHKTWSQIPETRRRDIIDLDHLMQINEGQGKLTDLQQAVALDLVDRVWKTSRAIANTFQKCTGLFYDSQIINALFSSDYDASKARNVVFSRGCATNTHYEHPIIGWVAEELSKHKKKSIALHELFPENKDKSSYKKSVSQTGTTQSMSYLVS